MADAFPRGLDLPSQSPLFWVNNKDRYLRQLLISDIQIDTGRDLIVYFSDCDKTSAQIDQLDDIYLSELLAARKSDNVDLLIETNGGFTDATEKICSVLLNAKIDLRVIVPRRAKSNGTVIAFCGRSILMGCDSELGPIDPFVNGIPADFVRKAGPALGNPLLVLTAESAISQTRKLASQLLGNGMLKAKNPDEINILLDKLASRDVYHSHGAVIDAGEAKSIGLNVEKYESADPLWKKLWLLRSMYSFDCQIHRYSKIFEGKSISCPVAVPPAPAP